MALLQSAFCCFVGLFGAVTARSIHSDVAVDMLLHSSALQVGAGDGAVFQQLLHLAVAVAHRLQKLLGLRADLPKRGA